ncbi:hypothetical protein MRX96_012256 [Rhipicephalus microplus]
MGGLAAAASAAFEGSTRTQRNLPPSTKSRRRLARAAAATKKSGALRRVATSCTEQLRLHRARGLSLDRHPKSSPREDSLGSPRGKTEAPPHTRPSLTLREDERGRGCVECITPDD